MTVNCANPDHYVACPVRDGRVAFVAAAQILTEAEGSDMQRILATLFIFVLTTGCKDEAKERADQQAKAAAEAKSRAELESSIAARVHAEIDAAAADKAKKEAASGAVVKKDMAENPDKYLTYSDVLADGRGGEYGTLSEIRIENKSPYKVKDIKGKLTWIDYPRTSDFLVAMSSDFSVEGALEPGEARTFTVAGGNLSKGTVKRIDNKAPLHFTGLKVVE